MLVSGRETMGRRTERVPASSCLGIVLSAPRMTQKADDDIIITHTLVHTQWKVITIQLQSQSLEYLTNPTYTYISLHLYLIPALRGLAFNGEMPLIPYRDGAPGISMAVHLIKTYFADPIWVWIWICGLTSLCVRCSQVACHLASFGLPVVFGRKYCNKK